jgi:outer membrane protein assembly factor BamB
MMKYPLLFLTLALTAPVPPGRPAVGDWPQWRGPDRNDISRETGLLKTWPSGGPRLLWTFREAGAGYSGPAVVGDRLYCMGAEGKTESLYALDLKTQKKVWSAEVGPLFKEGHGDGPRGTPTVDGDLVFGIGGQGTLLCVKAATGEKVWSKNLKTDLGGAMMSGWGYTESPLVDGDKVVCTPGGSKGALAALNKKTGELIWQSREFTDKAAYSSVTVIDPNGVRQYCQITGESVVGVAPDDGKLLWKHPRRGQTAVIPTPVYADNLVFVTSGYGIGCNLIKLVPDGGKFKAEEVYANKNMVNHHGGVVLLGDYLYGYSDGKGWICQNFKTGEIVWAEKNKLDKGSLTYADDHLYCLGERAGDIVLVKATPDGWKEDGRFKIPEDSKIRTNSGRVWTHPVVANGKLYLRDQDLIFCYDIKSAATD